MDKFGTAIRFNTFEKACDACNANNRTEEDGWHYEIEEAGPYFVIAAYDENNTHLGYL